MESLIHKERRKSQRIPVELVLVGEIEGHQVAMYSTNISLDGMFVQAREFIRPCTGFFAQALAADVAGAAACIPDHFAV